MRVVLPRISVTLAGAAAVVLSNCWVHAFVNMFPRPAPASYYDASVTRETCVVALSAGCAKSHSTGMVLGSTAKQRQPQRQLRPELGLVNRFRSAAGIGKRQLGSASIFRAARRDGERYDDGGREEEGEEEDEEYEYDEGEVYEDTLDRNVSKRLKQNAVVFRQVSWLSWWAQTILSTVAFIILLFSNAVTNRSARGNILGNGVALALSSLFASGASICWTWGYTLKARGWPRLATLAEVDDAQLRMRNSLKMGLYINVIGMLVALVGAEQIVGTLVAKVLYSQGFQPSVMVGGVGAPEMAQAQFRALDVFIVQANTNTLLSHFCSLAATLWLLQRAPKLAKLARGVY